MSELFLVDTSAWIVSFRKAGAPLLKEFLRSSITAELVMTCPVVILELLQGCKTETERDNLRTKLESLEVRAITPAVWERTYSLGFSLARKGVIVPTADLVIASVAIENEATLLHQDRHYETIAKHVNLKTKCF